MSANDRQVNGTHYKNAGIPDHWDIVEALGWDYLTGCATKYLWRLGKKDATTLGKLSDLAKAQHYLDKKRELLEAELNADLDVILKDDGSEPGRGYVKQD